MYIALDFLLGSQIKPVSTSGAVCIYDLPWAGSCKKNLAKFSEESSNQTDGLGCALAA